MIFRLIRKIGKEAHSLISNIQYLLSANDGSDTRYEIVFIVGCGRSGTTILGEVLGLHPEIHFLNEPRNLWKKGYGETDIWSHKAHNRKKRKLVLNKEDLDDKKSKRLHYEFKKCIKNSNKRIVIEKTPINAFRLDFLYATFPNAKFIILDRNGLEVADSIQKISHNQEWFGRNQYKWSLIKKLAKEKGYNTVLNLIKNDFDKGLLEWRLSNEHIEKFLQMIDESKYIRINYFDLTQQPTETVLSILDFLCLRRVNKHLTEVDKIVLRKNNSKAISLHEHETMIGGNLLVKSLSNQTKLKS